MYEASLKVYEVEAPSGDYILSVKQPDLIDYELYVMVGTFEVELRTYIGHETEEYAFLKSEEPGGEDFNIRADTTKYITLYLDSSSAHQKNNIIQPILEEQATWLGWTAVVSNTTDTPNVELGDAALHISGHTIESTRISQAVLSLPMEPNEYYRQATSSTGDVTDPMWKIVVTATQKTLPVAALTLGAASFIEGAVSNENGPSDATITLRYSLYGDTNQRSSQASNLSQIEKLGDQLIVETTYVESAHVSIKWFIRDGGTGRQLTGSVVKPTEPTTQSGMRGHVAQCVCDPIGILTITKVHNFVGLEGRLSQYNYANYIKIYPCYTDEELTLLTCKSYFRGKSNFANRTETKFAASATRLVSYLSAHHGQCSNHYSGDLTLLDRRYLENPLSGNVVQTNYSYYVVKTDCFTFVYAPTLRTKLYIRGEVRLIVKIIQRNSGISFLYSSLKATANSRNFAAASRINEKTIIYATIQQESVPLSVLGEKKFISDPVVVGQNSRILMTGPYEQKGEALYSGVSQNSKSISDKLTTNLFITSPTLLTNESNVHSGRITTTSYFVGSATQNSRIDASAFIGFVQNISSSDVGVKTQNSESDASYTLRSSIFSLKTQRSKIVPGAEIILKYCIYSDLEQQSLPIAHPSGLLEKSMIEGTPTQENASVMGANKFILEDYSLNGTANALNYIDSSRILGEIIELRVDNLIQLQDIVGDSTPEIGIALRSAEQQSSSTSSTLQVSVSLKGNKTQNQVITTGAPGKTKPPLTTTVYVSTSEVQRWKISARFTHEKIVAYELTQVQKAIGRIRDSSFGDVTDPSVILFNY